MSVKCFWRCAAVAAATLALCFATGCGDGEDGERDPALVGDWLIEDRGFYREYRVLQNDGRLCMRYFDEITDFWVEYSDCGAKWHTENGTLHINISIISLEQQYSVSGDTAVFTDLMAHTHTRGDVAAFRNSLGEIRAPDPALHLTQWHNPGTSETLSFTGASWRGGAGRYGSSLTGHWYTEGSTLFLLETETYSSGGGPWVRDVLGTVELQYSISGSGNARKLTLTNAELGINDTWSYDR